MSTCSTIFIEFTNILSYYSPPGIAIIFFTIPLTGKVSLHMKTLQKALSKVRDERIKLSNEVLSGMKVIKLQAWEREFQNRIIEVRERELALFRK